MNFDVLVDVTLLSVLAVVTLVLVSVRNLFAAAMLFAIFSLLVAGIFLILDAGDVALTEAAVGGVLSMLIIVAISMCKREQAPRKPRRILPLAMVMITGACLVYGTSDMPAFGDPQAPAQVHVGPRYTQDSVEEIGIPNMVTSVLASYRGYDTLGEVAVIFAGGVGVLLVLAGAGAGRRERESSAGEDPS